MHKNRTVSIKHHFNRIFYSPPRFEEMGTRAIQFKFEWAKESQFTIIILLWAGLLWRAVAAAAANPTNPTLDPNPLLRYRLSEINFVNNLQNGDLLPLQWYFTAALLCFYVFYCFPLGGSGTRIKAGNRMREETSVIISLRSIPPTITSRIQQTSSSAAAAPIPLLSVDGVFVQGIYCARPN